MQRESNSVVVEAIMATTRIPRLLRDAMYTRYAQEYLASLPMEHFMESRYQSTQREITTACLRQVKLSRPDIQIFSELLVQYPIRGERRPGQVVPDNMVVLHDTPIDYETYYATDLHPWPALWMLEYVSKNNQRKDYERNLAIYEQLRVPYYLIFYPDNQDLTLFRLNSRRTYRAVRPNDDDRVPLVELDLEMGLLDGWVRYWFRGELVPLTGELKLLLNQREQQLAEREQQLAEREQQLADARQQLADRDRRLAEMERELARLQGTVPPADSSPSR